MSNFGTFPGCDLWINLVFILDRRAAERLNVNPCTHLSIFTIYKLFIKGALIESGTKKTHFIT